MDMLDLFTYRILIYSKSKDTSECAESIRELASNDHFKHCRLSWVDSLSSIKEELTSPFFGVLVLHLSDEDYSFISNAVEIRNSCKVDIPIIALLDGDAIGMDIPSILQMNISDVAVCGNKQWLAAVLAKYFFISRNSSNIIDQAPFDVFSSFINQIHNSLPFGIIRVVIEPQVYIEYINREAERILSLTHHELLAQPELIQRFLPNERIKLVLENASTGEGYLRKRFKISLKGEIYSWVDAVYIHGFKHQKKIKTIEVIIRDVTDEEINRALQKGVYDIARLTSSNFSLNRIFTIIHKIISDIINIENFYIALYDSETQEVSFPFYVDVADDEVPKPRKGGLGLTEYIIRTKKSLLCKAECLEKLIKNHEIELLGEKPKAWLGVPLKHYGNIIGVMAVQHYHNPDAFSGRERYILEFFSEQVAHTIEFKRKSDTVKLLSTAIEQSPVSIVITTLKSEIIYVNATFTKVTGYESSEVLGKNPRILQSGLTPPERYVEMWNTLISGNTWQGEFINKRKNGEIFYESSIIVPVTDELGKNTFYLAVKIDITEQKQLFQELVVAKEKAEESDRLKTAFLQNISHEIRTPMNAIVGFAEILESDHDDDEKVNYYTSVIKQRSFDLLDIVNELLDIASIESGQLECVESAVNLDQLFNEIKQTFVEYTKRMGKVDLTLKILNCTPSVNNVILTDEGKLKQIFNNLIHNAVKFTDRGKVEFGFHELNNDYIVFRVTDTGMGIPADMQDKIFKRFQKASFNPDVIYDGIGLGLTIIKGLIDLLDGKIWLNSKPGQGSTFFVSIPYKPVKVKEEMLKHVVNIDALKQFKFFVVEDDVFNIAYFNELFEGLNMNYHIESTGTEAIEHFRQNSGYDMVLMDIKLPDMNGYDVIEEFKTINPNVPIIAQTAYAAEVDKQKALAVGCVDYIPKPIFRDKLLEMLEKHLVINS